MREGEDEEDVEPSPVTPAASLLPLERALEGPSRDLLTQLLFPELNETEAKGNLETVLTMLRDAWSRSRPSSGSQLTSQQQQKRTVSSNRRQLSAPETRIRRYTIRTTTTTFESSPSTTSRSAPPALSGDMCTDSVTSTTTADSNSKMLQNNCYCHTYKQNEFKFSCKLNFEETRRHYYNCNYLNAYNMMPEYYPKLIPRYSSLPRSLSMLANCSSPSTSTSSVSSDEENQSLADSLEDISPYNTRLPYDDKPVRGAPPLLPHRPAPRIPIPRSEKFFIPLTDRETNEMLLLPPTLREKLERRRLELESKPKSSMNNRGLVVAQKSPRPLRSRRILGTKFQRFECIPEENEARRAGRFSHTRNYVSRERGLEGSRGLQAIMRDPHEVKVGLQQHQALEPAALQEVLPSSAVVARGKEVTSELARGRQAMGEDLVAVTTGWVNFYMLRGEETTTTTASSDSASTTVVTRTLTLVHRLTRSQVTPYMVTWADNSRCCGDRCLSVRSLLHGARAASPASSRVCLGEFAASCGL
ncbi:hypothetical protein B566_EDAN012606 [Ephemera danica]|nr:hypothetical protein B566_EDAN012606 [Ephemera danica]